MTFEQLLKNLSYDYKNPQAGDADKNGNTRLAILQEKYDLSSLKVQKLLVTTGVYVPVKSSSSYYTVKNLHDQGMDVNEIMKETGLSKAVINACLPYEKGIKEGDKLGVEISDAAVRKRRQMNREGEKKENAIKTLANTLSSESLWKAIALHSGETFKTEDGKRFNISLEDKHLIIDGIKITKEEVVETFHTALEIKADGKERTLGKYGQYLRSIFIFLGIIPGDASTITTRRTAHMLNYCSCCGRTGLTLYDVSTFSDLMKIEDQFMDDLRASWTEDERKRAEALEGIMSDGRKKYTQKIEAAQASKAVRAFEGEGHRQFCQLCALTIYDALVDGDAPFVGKKTKCREVPVEMARRYYENQLYSTGERWIDKFGYIYQDVDLYKSLDSKGEEHFFVLSSHTMGTLLAFDAQEVHRLTKSGKRAVNNTDTDYEFHHLITLAEDDNEEQRLYAGLIELIDEITAGLEKTTVEDGNLRTTGTIIPVYLDNGSYGFLIDGKVYTGEEFASLASSVEGWQIQFQVKDPTENVLRANEYLMPVRLGRKEMVDDMLELIRLFTKDGRFISDHDKENFSILFDGGVLEKLKIYHESNPRGYGKLAGMDLIKALDMYDDTERLQERVREIIRT